MSRKASNSPLCEADQIQLASDLIRLGARLQVLESVTKLSREKLLRLYKEILKKSPPKGQLPFSTDWYISWQANIHASLFMNYYQGLVKETGLNEANALSKAYRFYLEQIGLLKQEEVLSLTRAWRLVKFFEADMMTMLNCTQCNGAFVSHTFELSKHYKCGLCNIPSRAGKTKKRLKSEAAGA